jgi:hypothetical protein
MPVATKIGIRRADHFAPNHVQGIASSLDDLTIRGEKLKAVPWRGRSAALRP